MPKFGVVIPQGMALDLPDLPPSQQFSFITRFVQDAEKHGFDSIWVNDHFVHTTPKVSYLSCFECWTTLAALMSLTRKVRLGQIVTCNSYRNPALLAKMAAVLDVISNGRLEVGIGAGWYDYEYKAYGIPFEKASIRIAKLEEAINVIKQLWTRDLANYEGNYYQVHEAICTPKPIQKPHPPLMIGGSGERLVLKVVAKLADRCNFNGPIENYKRKLEVLEDHCKNVGRDFKEIEKTILIEVVIRRTTKEADEYVKLMQQNGLLLGNYLGNGKFETISPEQYKINNIVGNPDECLEKLESYSEIGVENFIFGIPMTEQLEPIRILAEHVIPKMR